MIPVMVAGVTTGVMPMVCVSIQIFSCPNPLVSMHLAFDVLYDGDQSLNYDSLVLRHELIDFDQLPLDVHVDLRLCPNPPLFLRLFERLKLTQLRLSVELGVVGRFVLGLLYAARLAATGLRDEVDGTLLRLE